MSRIDKSIGTERLEVVRRRGWGHKGSNYSVGNGVFFWGDDKVLKLKIAGGYTALCMH